MGEREIALAMYDQMASGRARARARAMADGTALRAALIFTFPGGRCPKGGRGMSKTDLVS